VKESVRRAASEHAAPFGSQPGQPKTQPPVRPLRGCSQESPGTVCARPRAAGRRPIPPPRSFRRAWGVKGTRRSGCSALIRQEGNSEKDEEVEHWHSHGQTRHDEVLLGLAQLRSEYSYVRANEEECDCQP